MADYDYNPVVWVSVASRAGLSLVSVGQPGLRTDLDEQVYTGGLTAVQQMIGGEVGGDTERFVGGSHSNKTGRFMVTSEHGELVGQYLLISPDNRTVAPELVEHYEYVVTFLAEETLKTEIYQEIGQFRALGVNHILDIFFECIKRARKKKSIQMDDELLKSALSQVSTKSINDYEYSPTLVKVSEYKGKYRDLCPRIKSERNDLVTELSEDVLELLTSEHPHALVKYSKIGSLHKDFEKHLRSEIANIEQQDKVSESLKEIIQEFEENDLKKVLEDFALVEVTKTNLHARLENEIFTKFQREFPLLVIVDPEIKGFQESLKDLTTRINEEYDVGGTLSRIGHDMLKGYEKEEALFIPYIRHFCDQFSAGLTLTSWKYVQIFFKLITMETKVDVTNVLPTLKDQIPDSHFKTLQKMITKYKLTKLDPITFTVKKATDILPFYRALFSALGFGINAIITDIVLGDENPDNFLKHTAEKFNEFCTKIHQIFAIFSIYEYLEKKRSRMPFPLVYPELKAFGNNVNVATLDVQAIIEAFVNANTNSFQKEQQLVERKLDEFQKAFEKRVQEIEKYLSRNPLDISKGLSLNLKDADLLTLSTISDKDIGSELQKTQSEYGKIIEQLQSNLDKAQKSAQEFIDGKIQENKLESNLANRGFLSKGQENLEKTLRKTRESIEKRYSNIFSDIGKQINGFQKDFNKQFLQACPSLNINRKALVKGDDFLPNFSPIIDKIQSAIKKIVEKEQLLTWENLGSYYFYSKNRRLRSNIRFEISNALVHKKSYPLLKEATEVLKENPASDVFKSYAEVLDDYAKDYIALLFSETRNIIGKEHLKSNPDIFFVEKNKVPVPTMEMGVLTNTDAMNSIRSLLGSDIAVEAEKQEGVTLFHVSASIPDFGCDFKGLKKVWKKKTWKLSNVFLLLSWHSLLNSNNFFINMLRYSAGMYSSRVKDSFEETLQHIQKIITS